MYTGGGAGSFRKGAHMRVNGRKADRKKSNAGKPDIKNKDVTMLYRNISVFRFCGRRSEAGRRAAGRLIHGLYLCRHTACICLACICLTACGGRNDPAETKSRFQDGKEYLPMSNLTESDDGIYYVESIQEHPSDNGYMVLKYVDKASAKETVLCQKVNCKHNTSECQAVAEGSDYMGFMTYSDGKLYYMVSEYKRDNRSLYLYRMNRDGTGKEQLHVFENQMTPPNKAGMYKGKIFLSLPTMKASEDNTSISSAEPSLVMYDLETKTETMILDGARQENLFVLPCGASGDNVYFLEMRFMESPDEELDEEPYCKFRQYDLNTREIRTVLDTVEEDAQIVYNDRILRLSKDHRKMYSYDLITKETEDILEWKENYHLIFAADGYIGFEKRRKKQYYFNCYDLKEKRYIFDEMTLEDEAYVKTRLTTGEYWIQKDEAVWLYDLSKDSWRKVEEIT